MSQQQKNNLIIGLLLIMAGIVVLLSKFALLPPLISQVIFSWPMLLIVIGIISWTKKQRSTGNLLILIGIVFLIPRTGLIPGWSMDKYWPIFLIVLGIFLILRHYKKSQEEYPHAYTHFRQQGSIEGEYFQEAAFFGGSEKSIISKNLKGGRVQCMFGGVELNMTNAEFDGQQAMLDIYVAFGGIEIIVPPTWIVKSDITPILGGFSDKRYIKPSENAPILFIKGTVIFGGCEVKSYI
jgi:predicted membrane protein